MTDKPPDALIDALIDAAAESDSVRQALAGATGEDLAWLAEDGEVADEDEAPVAADAALWRDGWMAERVRARMTGSTLPPGKVDNTFCKTGQGGGVDPSCGKEDSTQAAPTAKDIVQKTHKLADVVAGKYSVGVEGRGGKDLEAAKQHGLYTNTIGGVGIYARDAASAKPLEDYLHGGGKYGTLTFSRLLGYTESEIKEYAKFLKAQGDHHLVD